MARPDKLTIALAQINLLVGDVRGNLARVIEAARRARDVLAADLVLFPELTLSGYPPEDLLFHRGLRRQIEQALEELKLAVPQIGLVVGFPEYQGSAIYNAAQLLRGGRVLAHHRKACLPNYQVFDEKRYFTPGTEASVVEFDGYRLGLLICEDVWEPEPAMQAKSLGAEALLIINASPYELHKQREREHVVGERVAQVELPVVSVNLLGGQDELVFDGNSFVMDAHGRVVARARAFEETLFTVELERAARAARPGAARGAAGADSVPETGGSSAQPAAVIRPRPGTVAPELSDEESVYRALTLGVRDYVDKHGFPGVVMGLSGGVDSALTLAIAVDALGPDRVHVVMMPSRYTSQMSREDAASQARTLGVSFSTISIEQMFEATLDALREEFAGRAPDATEENIQARCRGLLLMAISNKTRRMLLTTGNKSEMAVGYATLYGDMAGGFAPIKDCSKTLVYRLAHYRNAISPVIPQRVITRAPTAELRPNQKDTDSLPPYEVLDPILEAFIEEDLSVEEICERGFDRAVVARVLDMVKSAEYKRRQAPPGVRVSRRAFGRDWRYPITSGYRR
jgi:NAD+ synthase (glutamine-hydrolysing)